MFLAMAWWPDKEEMDKNIFTRLILRSSSCERKKRIGAPKLFESTSTITKYVTERLEIFEEMMMILFYAETIAWRSKYWRVADSES